MPKVSVILPIYNRENYARESIESILSQTFSDFELIIVDDGSTDGTKQLVEGYDHQRIVTIALPANCGISAARNVGLAAANGDLIALMDSDDIAMPDRLAVQASFLEDHADIAIVGSGDIKAMGQVNRPQTYPANDAIIKAFLLSMNGSAMANGTSMMRRAFLQANEITYRNRPIDEDHALWIDAMVMGAKFHNIDRHHILSRRHEGNITAETSAKWLKYQEHKTPLRAELLGIWFPDLSANECRALARFLEHQPKMDIEEVGIGLAAADKAIRYRGNRYGASQPHINSILIESCQRVRKVLNKVLLSG